MFLLENFRICSIIFFIEFYHVQIQMTICFEDDLFSFCLMKKYIIIYYQPLSKEFLHIHDFIRFL